MSADKSGNGGAGGSDVQAVPLSRVVCISEISEKNGSGKGCEAEEADAEDETVKRIEELAQRSVTLHEEHNLLVRTLIAVHDGHGDYVTEGLLRQYITEKMECAKDGRQVHISEFIRFNRDEANIKADPANEKKIDNFVSRWAGKDGVGRWAVFGFASPDGERTRNNKLSSRRVEAVKGQMCPSKNEDECKAKFGKIEFKDSGENHPINGVANSRSAVIAVCVQQDGIS